MAEQFDAYHKWLGISPEKQPPNLYQLLAVDEFESDPDVIEAAADQRMSHVRTYQTSKHAKLSQELLNEVSTARVTLLKPDKKAEYDQQLQLKLAVDTDDPLGPSVNQLTGGTALAGPASFVSQAATHPAGPAISAKPTIKKTPAWILPVGISVGALVILGVVIAVVVVAVSNKGEPEALVAKQNVDKGSGEVLRPKIRQPTRRSSQRGELRKGLTFDGLSFVQTNTRFSSSTPITIEAIAIPTSVGWTQSVLGNIQNSGIAIEVKNGRWVFTFHDKDGYRHAYSKQPAEVGKRAVLAGVFDDRTIRMFVNGELQSTLQAVGHKPARFRFKVGADPDENDQPDKFFSGVVESVRISSGALYSDSYQPVESFAPEKSTILLLRFEKGEGDVAYDSSSGKNHCTIVGAKWTTLDADSPTKNTGL